MTSSGRLEYCQDAEADRLQSRRALTCNEIVRLLYELFKVEHDVGHVLSWLVFKRAHKARALTWATDRG